MALLPETNVVASTTYSGYPLFTQRQGLCLPTETSCICGRRLDTMERSFNSIFDTSLDSAAHSRWTSDAAGPTFGPGRLLMSPREILVPTRAVMLRTIQTTPLTDASFWMLESSTRDIGKRAISLTL